MKLFFATFLCLISLLAVRAANRKDSLLHQLKTEISRKGVYEQQKLQRIKRIALLLPLNADEAYLQLFNEYEYYKFDSAYFYGKKLLDLRLSKHNPVKISESKVKIASLLLHAGMFKETFDLLGEIKVKLLNSQYQYEYYCLKSGAYSNLAIYNDDPNFTVPYNKKAVALLDSAIAVCEPNSFERLFTAGNREVVAGETRKTPAIFIKLLQHFKLTAHQRARLLTAMAAFYRGEKQHEQRICLLAESAIYDIRSSTRETLATLLLSEELFRNGYLDDAYLFIQQSRDDAGFYGNRLRKLKIESVLPDIAAQVNLVAQREKNKFLMYFLAISMVTIIILLVAFVIYIQLKKLKAKERIINEKNLELERINLRLIETNDKLREYATLNERYIGTFFNTISGYILKLDRLKKNVERKILAKRFAEVLPSLNDIDIKKEREQLFNTFDSVFMSVFPNFITVFNSMFDEKDQIWPKAPELLNTDLRIFALTRLGISDVQTIANILEYSVNTVYVYKMRLKAKALVPAEEFDHIIMSVKAV
ncbi:DUF6377 domain-containing protein [Pedobacter aquatilis]|uniref:DUF6377 domain-containing protein n=1 Tax=Pedobacter aquatilis TaxID=351343 RepID=UPI00292E6C32|nr:DUF6377 domain-containing protein [Pedobacter aquatilis]